MTRKYAFSRYSTDLQLSLIQLVSLVNLLKKMQKYKIIAQFFFENPIDVDLIISKRKSISFFKAYILNITGLRPTLKAYYIFDTGIAFTRVKSTSIYNVSK